MNRAGRAELRALVVLFLRLGATAFGGPAAHIALMRREVVRQRAWLSEEEFLDVVGASSIIPGPTSTEVALYVGRRRAGLTGLVVAGVAFILPAALIVGALAWAYVRYETTPAVEDLLYGTKPVVLVIVVGAVLGLARTAVKSMRLALVGSATLVLYLAEVTEPVLLFGAAAVAAILAVRTLRPRMPPGAALLALVAGPSAVTATSVGLPGLALVFLKVGALLFGSGYVLVAFLQRDLVEARHWLTEVQLLDAVTIGQVTPGPLFTTATFVGYLLAGWPGAVVATVAIFLPSFVFTAALDPLIVRLRRSATAAAAMDGLNVAAVAVMAGVAGTLARDAVVDLPTAAMAAVAGIMLLGAGDRLNPAWLLPIGAATGLILRS